MSTKLADVLQEFGIPINFQAGGKTPERLVEREVPQGAPEIIRHLSAPCEQAYHLHH